jgi:hypothetical protein
MYDAEETEVETSHDADNPPDPTCFTTKIATRRDPDYDSICPFFGWLVSDLIKKTFEHITQYARFQTGTTIKKSVYITQPWSECLQTQLHL